MISAIKKCIVGNTDVVVPYHNIECSKDTVCTMYSGKGLCNKVSLPCSASVIIWHVHQCIIHVKKYGQHILLTFNFSYFYHKLQVAIKMSISNLQFFTKRPILKVRCGGLLKDYNILMSQG